MKYKLSDCVEIISGGTPKKAVSEYWDGNIPWITIKDFGSKYPKSTDNYITQEGLNHSAAKLSKDKDILISARGTVGEVMMVHSGYTFNQSIYGLRIKEKVAIPEYIYYWLLANKQIFIKNVHGSVFDTITRKIFDHIQIELPCIANQAEIVSKLNSIDSKIALNELINDNLTNQLHTISDNYFSYFNFNDGSIPQNWTYKNLTDIAEITSGYSYKGKELVDSDLGMATIKNFARTGGFQINGYKSIIPSKNVKQSQYASLFDMLIAHTDLTQNADIIGNAEPVLTTSRFKKIIYSMDLVKVIPKQNKISKWLLDLILMSTRVKAHCLGYVNGTTVLHLSKKALKEFEIPLPNDPEELSGITRIARNYLLMMSENMQENEKLIELKDQLLNKYF